MAGIQRRLLTYFYFYSFFRGTNPSEPESELPSLLLVTSIDVRHVHLNGTPVNGASRHATVETQVNTKHAEMTRCRSS